MVKNLYQGLVCGALASLAVVVTAWSAPAAATTIDEICKAMHWPLPLPSSVGYSLTRWLDDSVLVCFNNVAAIAPDGHDVMNSSANDASSWKVTSTTPPAGTMVTMNQQIKLTVVRDPHAPS